MKYCKQCGAELQDEDQFCVACGAEQIEPDAVAVAEAKPVLEAAEAELPVLPEGSEQSACIEPPKKKKKVWPWVVGSVVLVVFVLIGAAVGWLMSRPEVSVLAAATKSVAKLTGSAAEFTQTTQLIQAYNDFGTPQRMYTRIALDSEDTACDLVFKLDRSLRRASVEGSLEASGLDLDVAAYVDGDRIVFSMPQVFKRDMAINMDTIGKDAANSIFCQMFDVDEDASFDIWGSRVPNFTDVRNEMGPDFSKWISTFQVEKDQNSPLIKKNRAKYYRITWDPAALNDLLDRSDDLAAGTDLPGIGDPGEYVDEAKQTIEGYSSENTVYVRVCKGYLDAIGFSNGEDLVQISLEGERNLWERIRIQKIEGDTVTELGVCEFSTQDRVLRGVITTERARADLEFSDADGSFKFYKILEDGTLKITGSVSHDDAFHIVVHALADDAPEVDLSLDVRELAASEEPATADGTELNLFDLQEKDLYTILDLQFLMPFLMAQ